MRQLTALVVILAIAGFAIGIARTDTSANLASFALTVASPVASPIPGNLICPALLATAVADDSENEGMTGGAVTQGIDDRFTGWQQILVPSIDGRDGSQDLSIRTTTYDFDGSVSIPEQCYAGVFVIYVIQGELSLSVKSGTVELLLQTNNAATPIANPAAAPIAVKSGQAIRLVDATVAIKSVATGRTKIVTFWATGEFLGCDGRPCLVFP